MFHRIQRCSQGAQFRHSPHATLREPGPLRTSAGLVRNANSSHNPSLKTARLDNCDATHTGRTCSNSAPSRHPVGSFLAHPQHLNGAQPATPVCVASRPQCRGCSCCGRAALIARACRALAWARLVVRACFGLSARPVRAGGRLPNQLAARVRSSFAGPTCCARTD